ncbi:DUF2975 domain-containing protein [uncultured Sulfitobacter sp.]|uniref:DUF2975 domain-containing protein n=1 Tax=uncultured Sulfitobacter sp. TaxID=191468 RepID=UPI00261BA71E|nr:DUF2975 domain-containing protein [uncultured Sulfitobacter sp.]
MPSLPKTADRLQTTATLGVWLTTAVLILLSGVIAFFLWTALTDSGEAARLLADQLGMNDPAPFLSIPQALLLTLLWLISDVVAFIMLLQIRALFVGIRARGIFTTQTAERLRRIGWLVFIIAPVGVLVNMCASMLLHHWRDPTGLHGSISMSDGDFYAMVIGLVIVAVGHIMVDATRLDAENRAFV